MNTVTNEDLQQLGCCDLCGAVFHAWFVKYDWRPDKQRRRFIDYCPMCKQDSNFVLLGEVKQL